MKLWSRAATIDLTVIILHIAKDNFVVALKRKGEILQRSRVLIEQPKIGKLGKVETTHEFVLSDLDTVLIYRLIDGKPKL